MADTLDSRDVLPPDAMRAATAADVQCNRQSCTDAICDGFLCRKALISIYGAATQAERDATIAMVDSLHALEFDAEKYREGFLDACNMIADAIKNRGDRASDGH